MLRLYGHPVSSFVRRVRIALIEKKIDHEFVEVDMFAGAHKRPEYLALNPYGRVPAIDDDGFVLFESAAILMYLEATRPSPALVPDDPRGRALVDLHLRLCDAQFAVHAATILFPKRFRQPETWDHRAMEIAKAQIERHFGILEQTLGNREYIVGDRFTLADVAYIPLLHFVPLMQIELGITLAAWRDRLLARPSAQATVPPR